MGAQLHARFALANRHEIEDEIERLLALLDADDGDCDLEEDDWSGTGTDCGEGEGHFGQGLLPTLPLYGLDQSSGPINEREAIRAHQMAMIRG